MKLSMDSKDCCLLTNLSFTMNRRVFLKNGSLALAGVAAFRSFGAYGFDNGGLPHSERIRYDAMCLTIDEKDTFIYSGAFHYFRCPKELWRDRFQKIKEAHFNTVETYTPWNWHERLMPDSPRDFSKIEKLKDLDEWLTMAEEFGFNVIVRPGPYICAEWDNGGFPLWLSALKTPAKPLHPDGWMRSDDPIFLMWTKHWFDAVCPIIAKHQITRKAPGKPGVILFQLENEYDSASFADDIKIGQLKALARFARAGGIDVPFITCWTKQVRGSKDPILQQIFDSCNFYPRWNVTKELGKEIPKLRREQPNAPLSTTELQGGWLSVVGGKLSDQQEGLTATQIQNITLCAWQMGETITNYYMLFGGTNFDDWGGYNITTTYDYAAPIREHGGVDARYQSVKALGEMIREHGEKLVRARLVEVNSKTTHDDVTVAERQASDGSRYFFVRTDNHSGRSTGLAEVKEQGGAEFSFEYDLEAFGSLVLYLPAGETDTRKGEWLPKPAPAVKRPTDLSSSVQVKNLERLTDPVPSAWTSLKPNELIEAHAVLDSHFIYYRIRGNAGATIDIEVQPKDEISGSAGAKMLPVTVSPDHKHFSFTLPPDANELIVIHDKHGHRNGPKGMETGGTYGLLSVKGANDSVPLQFAQGGSLGKERTVGEAISRGATGIGHGWKPATFKQSLGSVPQSLLTWYRMQFELPTPKPGVWVPWHLHLEAMGNGFIYINGQCLGRYWQVGPQHDFYIPETWLNYGVGKVNTIALNLRPLDKDVCIQDVQIVPDNAFAEFR
ncbi:beta-galactosidase-like protein [Mucilaginibacter yixingensis]|uniref:Beta-galactosidase-like protein n=2 Tax=Mucilaginibacter yixingensis TaxID=1295612 RepID=A0A2T5J5W2_9SPHI|nr:beta-galactosidase-like protein [Mucilaginibacter yixingensis]